MQEDTKDQTTASAIATRRNTAMSGPTSNNNGKELTVVEVWLTNLLYYNYASFEVANNESSLLKDQSPTAATEPNTVIPEPLSNNEGRWLTKNKV